MDMDRRSFVQGSMAALVGSIFDLRPSEAAAVVQQVVEEQEGVPTFVIRGTEFNPRISVEGELNALTLVSNTEYDNGLVRDTIFTMTFRGKFAIRDERTKE